MMRVIEQCRRGTQRQLSTSKSDHDVTDRLPRTPAPVSAAGHASHVVALQQLKARDNRSVDAQGEDANEQATTKDAMMVPAQLRQSPRRL